MIADILNILIGLCWLTISILNSINWDNRSLLLWIATIVIWIFILGTMI